MSAEPSTSAGASTGTGAATGTGPSTEPSAGAAPAPKPGAVLLRIAGAFGAVLAYGCLAAFLYLISLQLYRWFREGDWTRFGVTDAMQVWLTRCCVKDGDMGRLAALVRWLQAPTDWLGLHKVLEIVPASLALFALSILGNSIYIYCRDRRDACGRPDAPILKE
jgi:hypothetical protein